MYSLENVQYLIALVTDMPIPSGISFQGYIYVDILWQENKILVVFCLLESFFKRAPLCAPGMFQENLMHSISYRPFNLEVGRFVVALRAIFIILNMQCHV
jgi:hypothetical protein